MTERNDNTTETPELSAEDLGKIAHRLEDIFQSCRSLWQMSSDHCGNENKVDTMEAFRLAVSEMSRANIRGLDAVIAKLRRGSAAGNFKTEFDFR